MATSGYIWLQWCPNDLKPVSSCFSSQSHSFWWVIWWNSMIFYFSSFLAIIWLQVAIFGYNEVEMTWNLFHRVSRPKAIHFYGSYDEIRWFFIFHQFRAVLGPLGPIPGKPDFSGKIRLCNFSSNIIPKLLAGFQKHPTSRFPELWKLLTLLLNLNLNYYLGCRLNWRWEL